MGWDINIVETKDCGCCTLREEHDSFSGCRYSYSTCSNCSQKERELRTEKRQKIASLIDINKELEYEKLPIKQLITLYRKNSKFPIANTDKYILNNMLNKELYQIKKINNRWYANKKCVESVNNLNICLSSTKQ